MDGILLWLCVAGEVGNLAGGGGYLGGETETMSSGVRVRCAFTYSW